MFSTINAGLRLLGCGLLLAFVVSIADSLCAGSMDCKGCDCPMLMIEDMPFHALSIRIYECTGCGAQEVKHLRPDGSDWHPGDPTDHEPAPAPHGTTADHRHASQLIGRKLTGRRPDCVRMLTADAARDIDDVRNRHVIDERVMRAAHLAPPFGKAAAAVRASDRDQRPVDLPALLPAPSRIPECDPKQEQARCADRQPLRGRHGRCARKPEVDGPRRTTSTRHSTQRQSDPMGI